ncbi:hypothetical protein [uncultured Sphingomonas sp.]|uniref:helix-turn-helix domain-containing protein n=1 Tax=uncultured Sphingomonas sp. TaxID=158754 RepID=UPI00261050F7|nr:hypothetical protein [uncultured Sphingomonas sp.]
MTADEFRAARASFGISAEALARILKVQGSRTIYKWERGECAVPGPVAVLVTAMLESEDVRAYFGLAR